MDCYLGIAPRDAGLGVLSGRFPAWLTQGFSHRSSRIQTQRSQKFMPVTGSLGALPIEQCLAPSLSSLNAFIREADHRSLS